MDLSKGIFFTLVNSVDPDQTTQNAASLFIYSAFFFFFFFFFFVLQTYIKHIKHGAP